MSILVNLAELNDKHWLTIRTQLWIKPKTTFYQHNRYGSEPDTKPIVLFQKRDGMVSLPFTYANCLLGKFLVSNDSFPKNELTFTSELWEKQQLVAEEAVAQLNKFHTTTLWLPCGYGKTVISAYLCCRIKRHAVVIFKNKILKKQWCETFQKFTSAKIWIVGDEACPDSEPDVILCMVMQVYKIPLHWLDNLGALVLDEAHELCTSGYASEIMKISPCYVIACTATPIREDGAHAVLHAICGQHHVHRLPDTPLVVYQLLTGIKFTMGANRTGGPDWPGLCLEIGLCKPRNQMILDIVHHFWQRKIVILTVRVDQAAVLEQSLIDRYESVESMTGGKETYKPCRVLIGTFSKIGTAFDEATLCEYFDGMRIDMLIMAGSTRSKTRIVQALGRAERSANPLVIDMVDDNGSIERHWKVRRAIYKKRKAKISVITPEQIEEYGNGPRPPPEPVFIIDD